MQKTTARSKKKSELLYGYGDTVMLTEALERELAEQKVQMSKLIMKDDGTCTKYRNQMQQLIAEKDRLVDSNKGLRQSLQG